jgi:hypothetical protein
VLALAWKHDELQELMARARAAGVQLTLPALTAPSSDVFVIAPIASQTNTITIQAVPPGTQQATGITTLEIKDAAGVSPTVTWVAGVLTISLGTTDANNTLTALKAALDAALTTVAAYSTFITGTASTQMVHGGTNTRAASAAGVAAGTGVKSSTAGVAASRTLAIATQ